jgi:hypothetical protein
MPAWRSSSTELRKHCKTRYFAMLKHWIRHKGADFLISVHVALQDLPLSHKPWWRPRLAGGRFGGPENEADQRREERAESDNRCGERSTWVNPPQKSMFFAPHPPFGKEPRYSCRLPVFHSGKMPPPLAAPLRPSPLVSARVRAPCDEKLRSAGKRGRAQEEPI